MPRVPRFVVVAQEQEQMVKLADKVVCQGAMEVMEFPAFPLPILLVRQKRQHFLQQPMLENL